jgi:hypothetical protein
MIVYLSSKAAALYGLISDFGGAPAASWVGKIP